MCGICGKLTPELICQKCKIKLKNYEIFNIEDYSKTSSFFDEHIYMLWYSGEIRKAILNYKFNDKSYIYETFVNILKNNEKICKKISSYDIMIPIPISKKRFKQRGYNQSSIFAKKVANILKIKYLDKAILKIKNNQPQSVLNQEERIENVQNVYKINEKYIPMLNNKKILLIDDIFTTGSTANECSKILKQIEAKEIGIFTIAKD